MKGIKPLYYNITESKKFVCPLCRGRLILEKTTFACLNEDGRATEFNNFAGDYTTRIKCIKCGNDMTNQLDIKYIDGKPIYKLVNFEDTNHEVITIYNNKKDSFFNEDD